MIIRVIGVAPMLPDRQERPQTKYYQPQQKKEKVKKDFGVMLNSEIKKLHIDILI